MSVPPPSDTTGHVSRVSAKTNFQLCLQEERLSSGSTLETVPASSGRRSRSTGETSLLRSDMCSPGSKVKVTSGIRRPTRWINSPTCQHLCRTRATPEKTVENEGPKPTRVFMNMKPPETLCESLSQHRRHVDE